MKKIEIQIYAERLITTGVGLALAKFMPEGKEKEATIEVLNHNKDDVLKQLELLAEDTTFKDLKEVLGNVE